MWDVLDSVLEVDFVLASNRSQRNTSPSGGGKSPSWRMIYKEGANPSSSLHSAGFHPHSPVTPSDRKSLAAVSMVGLKPSDVPPPPAVKVLSAGMAGCIADLVTFPLDTAKVRLQIQGEKGVTGAAEGIRYRGVFGTISTMVRTEGPRSLYNGLVAGLQRQMAFASIRIGLYDSVKNFYTRGKDSEFSYNTHPRTEKARVRECESVGMKVWFWPCRP
ncbi:mitochondrial uncoupling protein 2 isoform a [Pimephales promelas]|nr:mitochondrial uncoupling protein 2 isoform a [Pimephales promelas]